MSRWYRAYEGTSTDPKLGEVAMIAECSRSVAIAAWHAVLENCASTNDGGHFDMTARRLAVILGEPVATTAAVMNAFEELGMTEGGQVCAWKDRQFESYQNDLSTERVRKHREKRKAEEAAAKVETGLKRTETPVERTETPPIYRYREEEERTASQTQAEASVAPPDPRSELFGRGLKCLVAMTGKAEPPARTLLGRWLKDAEDEAVIVLEAIDRAAENRPADPTAWISGVLRQRKQSRAPPSQKVWNTV